MFAPIKKGANIRCGARVHANQDTPQARESEPLAHTCLSRYTLTHIARCRRCNSSTWGLCTPHTRATRWYVLLYMCALACQLRPCSVFQYLYTVACTLSLACIRMIRTHTRTHTHTHTHRYPYSSGFRAPSAASSEPTPIFLTFTRPCQQARWCAFSLTSASLADSDEYRLPSANLRVGLCVRVRARTACVWVCGPTRTKV